MAARSSHDIFGVGIFDCTFAFFIRFATFREEFLIPQMEKYVH